MSSYTYKDLLSDLESLSEEQLNLDVVVYFKEADEFRPMKTMEVVAPGDEHSSVLDFGHPFLPI